VRDDHYGDITVSLLDRLLRAPGFARCHVVDFIDYHGLFVGNVADIALVGGAAMLGLRGISVGGTRGTGMDPAKSE